MKIKEILLMLFCCYLFSCTTTSNYQPEVQSGFSHTAQAEENLELKKASLRKEQAKAIQEERESQDKKQTEAKEQIDKQLKMQKTFVTALKINDLKTVATLCTDELYDDACSAMKQKCAQKKDGEACFHLATDVTKNFPNEKTKAVVALHFVDLACKYKYKNACDSRAEFKTKEREELSKQRDEHIKENVKCGKSEDDIIAYYGQPEASWTCNKGEYDAFNYGRTWILFKYSKSFLIQDHSEYKGPCNFDFSNKYRKSEVDGKWLCGE